MEEYNVYQTFNEILQYAENNPGTSYYDIKLKAYSENMEDWVGILRNKNSRKLLSILLKDIRRKNKVKYKNNELKIRHLAAIAEDKYLERIEGRFSEEMEESV